MRQREKERESPLKIYINCGKKKESCTRFSEHKMIAMYKAGRKEGRKGRKKEGREGVRKGRK